MTQTPIQRSFFQKTFFADRSPNSCSCREAILSSVSSILLGDALRVLRLLPDSCVQTVVTSPPYWSLRDYHIEGQIGLEGSVYDYVNRLADVFDEVKRVLRDDGTLWFNIGDCYTSGGGNGALQTTRTRRAPCQFGPTRPKASRRKSLSAFLGDWRLRFSRADGICVPILFGTSRIVSLKAFATVRRNVTNTSFSCRNRSVISTTSTR